RNYTALETAGPFSGAEGLSAGENIVLKAAALFREKTGYDRPVRAALEKRIPPGGGLGGGSSDAASTLRALDALAAARLGREELEEMGGRLGSDVPFFLSGSAALVTGRGERVRPLDFPADGLALVLVNPGFPSGTAAAFAKLDRFRTEKDAAALTDGLSGEDAARFLKDAPASWPYGNDFQPVLCDHGEHGAEYRRIFRDLREAGADFSGLSGSGSTCFGVFSDKARAKKAAEALFYRWNFVKLTFFLAQMPEPVLQ
ncbi:MAG: 4-(cytidine 5'-diphospho)-2-C-methyl-D-erythritol kinase, partial [Spirochaetaceae bacterium]|nr:4-(cytidine 5'-diphospho)-2-C-methyl-D-erythritol kinase [Spirochaetaceae bacterium]